ncbi:hypothetical protein ACQ5SO_08480 [Rhodovulum sp. DZ06]|uniref:hypothetical protein n=1 Tax=Rhodovulum sp. DZ06 TaxID=3425126 RepID=UPI003D32A09F
MSLPFFILTLPRSGSYHLVSLLDSAPDLSCHGEVYKRDRVELAPATRRRLGLGPAEVAPRDAMGMDLVKALQGRGKPSGFKAFPQHLEALPHRRALLFGQGLRRVALTRDPLAAYLSALRARATGRWVRMAGEAAPPVIPIRYDPDEFEARLAARARFDRLLDEIEAAAPGTLHRIDYDRLSDPGALTGLLRFLGSRAEGAALRSDRARQHCHPPFAGVQNPGEMEDHQRALGRPFPQDAPQNAPRAAPDGAPAAPPARRGRASGGFMPPEPARSPAATRR